MPKEIKSYECEKCGRLVNVNSFHLQVEVKVDTVREGKARTDIYLKDVVFCDTDCFCEYIKNNTDVF